MKACIDDRNNVSAFEPESPNRSLLQGYPGSNPTGRFKVSSSHLSSKRWENCLFPFCECSQAGRKHNLAHLQMVSASTIPPRLDSNAEDSSLARASEPYDALGRLQSLRPKQSRLIHCQESNLPDKKIQWFVIIIRFCSSILTLSSLLGLRSLMVRENEMLG